MITIRIGAAERPISDASESWINEQINRRRADNAPVCVQVIIREGGLDMILSTPGCPSTGGGYRAPNDRESRVFELWRKLHLDSDKFNGGSLNAFIKQVVHSL